MPSKRIDPRRVKLHHSYTVEEAARTVGAHRNSVRGWIKAGLPALQDRKPLLILGSDLRGFLLDRRKAAKRPSRPGHFYCLKCRQSRRPALGMVDFVPRSPATGNLRALCEACGKVMHRTARLASLASIMPHLDVQIREAEPRLIERTCASLNCDYRKG